MNTSRRQLTVLALLLVIGSLANNAGRSRVAVRAATDSIPGCEQLLQGFPVADYLKQHGMFDRVRSSVNANQVFIEHKKITASDGGENDRFGISVAISGSFVVIGAYLDNANRGSVYVFEQNRAGADNWGEVKKLTASDGHGGAIFGFSVRISGDTIVVGAPGHDSFRGAAYVFERNSAGADNWGEVKKLTASGAPDFGAQFGETVGISGDTIVGGASLADSARGAVYVFERNRGGASNWGEIKKLTASDGVANDGLGTAVGISGDTVVAGAAFDDALKGSAYVFERNNGGADNWGEVRKVTASDRADNDNFGGSAEISGQTIIVGSSGDDANKGSAYIFERNKGGADNWGEVRKLAAMDGAAGDLFSHSIAIDGDTASVGARNDDSTKGAAYVFERNRGGADNWGQVQRLTASDGTIGDLFGPVGVSGKTIIIGATGDDASKGSAYIFNAFPETVSVSAASFQTLALAPEMIAAAFGIDLATGLELAGTIPLPTNLRGTTVSVKDSAAAERPADLFFVSPGQVNYLVPVGTSAGQATVKITSGSGQISYGLVEIAAISPGIFAANANGRGVAAAQALRVRGTQQSYEQISSYDAGTSSFVPIPVDLGPPEEQIFLVMYGTGFRFRSSDSGVTVRVGGRTLQSLYSGVATGYVGLDQLNISALPRDLIGAGVVNIEITIDGRAANTTTVSIK